MPILWAPFDVGIEEDDEGVAVDEPPPGEVGAIVDLEDPPVEAPDVVAAGVEVSSGLSEVVAAATEEENDLDKMASVAAAPLPVEVRTAGRRDPTLLVETQVPATLLLIS